MVCATTSRAVDEAAVRLVSARVLLLVFGAGNDLLCKQVDLVLSAVMLTLQR